MTGSAYQDLIKYYSHNSSGFNLYENSIDDAISTLENNSIYIVLHKDDPDELNYWYVMFYTNVVRMCLTKLKQIGAPSFEYDKYVSDDAIQIWTDLCNVYNLIPRESNFTIDYDDVIDLYEEALNNILDNNTFELSSGVYKLLKQFETLKLLITRNLVFTEFDNIIGLMNDITIGFSEDSGLGGINRHPEEYSGNPNDLQYFMFDIYKYKPIVFKNYFIIKDLNGNHVVNYNAGEFYDTHWDSYFLNKWFTHINTWMPGSESYWIQRAYWNIFQMIPQG